MLTPRTQRFGLRLLALLALAGASALGSLTYRSVTAEAPRPEATPVVATSSEPTETSATRPSVDPASDAWRRRLRRPLYDPPPPPPKIVKKELPPIRSKLLGTILEPGASRAMISVPGGAVEFRSEGDLLGPHDPDAKIESINAQSITVSRGDETTQLTIDPGY